MHTSGCFVANATYGDDDLVEVQLLRCFRDAYLLNSILGRTFVWIYYHLGPYAAWFVERFPALRMACRVVLDRIVLLIERHTHLSRFTVRKELLRSDLSVDEDSQ